MAKRKSVKAMVATHPKTHLKPSKAFKKASAKREVLPWLRNSSNCK
ncbi:hypothetical protein HMPREF9104_02898 [Lentilactobacillus kisonensis F0435]|uniref:Uncharacterized protein n=1 Tax=Lentilactobacillus kisonensis F0435 TaxID=797516 RepID=H1LJV6_9LACO|nr:hypothetical protein HMPREF9104_02898 [Lentilactobacillus kisonensis F0435]